MSVGENQFNLIQSKLVGTGKSKLDQYKPEIEALLANGATQKFIAQRYDATEATVSRWIRKQGLQNK